MCSDKVKNGSESDVDCGGTCPACADGKACGAGTDCTSGVCTAGKCTGASCTDKDICAMLDDTLPVLRHHEKAAEELKMPAAQGRRP